jgi:transcription-repair coupling factor (superfamily II helicase)
VARLEATSETIQLQFIAHPPIDGGKVIMLVQKNRGWKLAGPTKLRIERVTSTLEERVKAVRSVYETLNGAISVPKAA